MKKIWIQFTNRIKFAWTNFRMHHNTFGRALKREARNTDVFGCNSDLLKLIDAKLALVQNSYEKWDVYVDQEYDLRDIKIVRSLIKKYLEDDFFDYIWPSDESPRLEKAQYVCKVYVNPRTIDRFLEEMDPVGARNKNLNKWYHKHIDEVYRYKLNRLIWNLLRDKWTNFSI